MGAKGHRLHLWTCRLVELGKLIVFVDVGAEVVGCSAVAQIMGVFGVVSRAVSSSGDDLAADPEVLSAHFVVRIDGLIAVTARFVREVVSSLHSSDTDLANPVRLGQLQLLL